MASLLAPFQLGDLQLNNRIALAPLTRARSGPDRIPNALMAEYYSQRASAGLLISEATTVSPQGNGWVESPGIYTHAMIEGWRQITAATKAKGATFFLQLWHTGRASHSDFHGGELPVSASAIKIEGDKVHTPWAKKDYETPRPLETDEIPELIASYKSAARNAKLAGFDGIEIHSANGYLLNQFLESKTNQRSDAYGGSIENRCRLLLEVLEAVMEVFPANRVAVRLSPNGAFNDMGSPDFREQHLYLAKQLEPLGLAYLHVVDGLGFGFHKLGEPITLAELRGVYSGTIMGNCGYTFKSACQAIDSGHADMISFGRPYISTPDLVERFAEGIPLNPDTSMQNWYTPNGATGYTDLPTATKARLP